MFAETPITTKKGKAMKLKRIVAAATATAVVALSLTSCSLFGGTQSNSTAESGPFPEKWDTEITIDVFDGLANQMGVQPGWFAKIVKDKFNMKLNVIAPNVAGGGDTLYNTRVAAGNLGDLIITDQGKQFDELVKGGLIVDMANYYEQMKNAAVFDAAVEKVNDGKDGVYGLPTQVSTIKPTEPSEGLSSTFGPMIRWDLYKQLGYPEIDSLEDLLPVLKQMQDLQPTAANGGKTYGLSLFKDWDGNMMNNAKQPTTFYGYDEMGFVLAKADGSDYQSIVDSDSEYVRALHFFYEANQMGLLDPDSTTQNYDTLFSKFQNGQVLFSPWPWQAQPAFNTEENLAAGQGFMIAPMKDQTIFSYGASVYGGKQIFAIGSKAKDPQRIAAFIDWLYSAEGTYSNNSQTQGAAGPQGLTWDLNSAGEPELSDFGTSALLGDGSAQVPEDWGGGTYKDGASWLNVTTVLPIQVDEATGQPFSYQFWPTYQAATANAVSTDWSAHMKDATSTMDYLQQADQILVAPGSGYVAPADSSEIQTLRNQIKASIVEFSWKMSFASNQSEFDSLLTQMQDTVNGLGYDKVLQVDMDNAKAQNDARIEVAKEFG